MSYRWAYGITTVPERETTTFTRTLESLSNAGFCSPTIFVDGSDGFENYQCQYEIVRRSSKLQAFGNWHLSLLELWIRYPRCDRYALFQDDILLYRNLKQYLDSYEMYPNHYWNLYTFQQNERLTELQNPHWYRSNQRGRGAIALVFHREVAYLLLSSPNFIAKSASKRNPHRSIDGAIINCFLTPKEKEQRVFEMVHYPSLTMHIGHSSAIGNPQHEREEPQSWLGENFDAAQMIETKL